MGAVPLVLGAVSSVAGTVSSFGGGTQTNSNSLAAVSLEQVDYLKQQQAKKEQLMLQMMQDVTAFANSNYDRELDSLATLRDYQLAELEQQQLMSEFNYSQSNRNLQDERDMYALSQEVNKFTNDLTLQQGQFARDLSEEQRRLSYTYNEGMRQESLDSLERQQGQAQRELNQNNRQDAVELNASNRQELRDFNKQSQLTLKTGQANYELDKKSAQLDAYANKEQFKLAEKGRQMETRNAQQKADLDTAQVNLNFIRNKSQLDTDSALLNINESRTYQDASAQNTSIRTNTYNEAKALIRQVKQARSEASKTLGSATSSSDLLQNIQRSGIEDIRDALDQSEINAGLNLGTVGASLQSSLATIGANRAGLDAQKGFISNERDLSLLGVEQNLNSFLSQQELQGQANTLNYLTLPEMQRQLELERSKTFNVDLPRQQVNIQRQSIQEQNQLERSSMLQRNELERNVLQQRGRIETLAQTNTANLARTYEQGGMSLASEQADYERRVAELQAGMQTYLADIESTYQNASFDEQQALNQAMYEQALSDINYGKQATNQSYDLGRYTAEQAKYSTQASNDMQSAAQLAQMQSLLSQNLSGIQTGLLATSPPSGGGVASGLAGVANIAGTISSAFNSFSRGQAQNSYYNNVSGLYGGSYSPTYQMGTTSYGTTPQFSDIWR